MESFAGLFKNIFIIIIKNIYYKYMANHYIPVEFNKDEDELKCNPS